MSKRSIAIVAYIGAAFTLAIAALVPFYLMGAFSSVVAHAGLHIDAAYSGGTVARTVQRPGYQILIYQPVRPRALQQVEPFVQVIFKPASALPAVVNEEIDLDGDGANDVRVTFAMDRQPGAKLRGDVVALNDKYRALKGVSNDSFSQMLGRVGDEVIVRVPLRR